MSDDSEEFSEEEFSIPSKGSPRGSRKAEIQMKLRQRGGKSYKEMEVDHEKLDGENANLENGEDAPDEENDPSDSIFSPQIELLLWKRISDKGIPQYLVKYKDYSYLHVEWLEESEICTASKTGKSKIIRFNKQFHRKKAELGLDDLASDSAYFDASYLDVDRILYTTELFPIIHPKKANEIKGKWSELLVGVVSKLLNFTKDQVHYGVYFMEPVNPDRDGVPHYKKHISSPMDLGTVLNRLYLDFYKSAGQFWWDLGLVPKNCIKFNKEPSSDIRILGDTVREACIILYKQWYYLQRSKYETLLEEYRRTEKSTNENSEDYTIQRQTEMEMKCKEEELKKIILEFESYQKGQGGGTGDLKSQIAEFISKNPLLFNSGIKFEDLFSGNPHQTTSNGVSNPQTPAIASTKLQDLGPSLAEIEQFNPGIFNFDWLRDERAEVGVEEEALMYLNEEDSITLSLETEIDRLYLVKWRNLSYIEATWEQESAIANPQKINDFKIFTRALDKESRSQMLRQVSCHKHLIDLMTNPKKRAKCGAGVLTDLKNKLYHYDVASYKSPIQYTPQTQPIFKDRKLLRDYQLDSLNWLIAAWYGKRNVILADEMGLGKTIQSMAFLNHLVAFENCRGPFLVIAPLSTLEHWKRSFEEWTNLNSVLYYDSQSIDGRTSCRAFEWFYTDISTKGTVLQSAEIYKFQVLITSYEVFLQDLQNILYTIPFQYVVVDEAHRLKNQNAKILGALKRMPCRRILLLTGTPIQNNTDELWSLLNYIEPDRFPVLDEFKREFGELSSFEQVERIQKILKPFLLRRMKEDVESSIPPLQETIIDVEMTTLQKSVYRALYEKNRGLLTKSMGITGTISYNTSFNNLEIQLRKCCNHPFLIPEIEREMTRSCKFAEEKLEKIIESSGKFILLDKLLPKLKAEGKKVLIFSQFTMMLDILEEYLKLKGYAFEKIDGSIKARERQLAIDRFNTPEKARDIFLLSTRAGGLGINLTSAQVVIIYDSDWNPQNDVQATARAHRIGQQNEVQVYRLLTTKTYEAEMFERATKKLGLDQAIFMGGAFQKADGTIDDKKYSKVEMELLLKKGILGLLEDNGEAEEAFRNENIDQILQKNSRLAKYSLINGTYSFSKSVFVSDSSNSKLDVHDPNFWSVVLKNIESPARTLLGRFDLASLNWTPIEQQNFVMELMERVSELINNKLSMTGLNADEEAAILELLNKVYSAKNFNKNLRDLAATWMAEVVKPSRRFKIFTLKELIDGGSRVSAVSDKRIDEDEEEKVFGDDGDGNGDSEFVDGLLDLEDEDGFKKLTIKEKEERLRRLCNYCERNKCTYFCTKDCKRAFHEECRRRVEDEGTSCGRDDLDNSFELIEHTMDDERLKKLMKENYVCADCSNRIATCFVCKQRGSSEKEKGELSRCSISACGKFYHLSCLSGFKLTKFLDTAKTKFRCSSHYCVRCGLSGESKALSQCFRCCVAYHIKCLPLESITKIKNKAKTILCQNHFVPVKTTPEKTVEKLNSKRKDGSKRRNGEKSDVKEKSEKSKKDSKKRTHSEMLNGGNGKGRGGVKEIVAQVFDKVKVYEELSIEPDSSFDYVNYVEDWCRYCGARYSSNFTKGPWGPRTLCTIHYIEWGQKKKLDLSKNKELPLTPINISKNTEVPFLAKARSKNPDVDVEDLMAKKKRKKENEADGVFKLIMNSEGVEIEENGMEEEVSK